MSTVKPFGDPTVTSTMIIGHDPRLQRSQSKAERAFFFEYLDKPKPPKRSEARKFELAQAVCEYVSTLAGYPVPRETLYVTNLCNEFLEHVPGSGTVFIPEAQAREGISAITDVVGKGRFRLILPMSQQVFYWLSRLAFVDESNELTQNFVANASPRPDGMKRGVYIPEKSAAFLRVCGHCFHHRGTPVIPVLHVKQWPIKARLSRYMAAMAEAKRQVSSILLT